MGKGVTQDVEELKKFNTPRENGFEGFEDRLRYKVAKATLLTHIQLIAEE